MHARRRPSVARLAWAGAGHPLIGRSITGGLRELVISYGRTGYVALYWFSLERDEVWILGVRHQRELDYPT